MTDQHRLDWNERHRGGDFEGRGPNPTLISAAAGISPGSALELASGSGTNAVWLASQGWRTTAVDWSSVGLANGRAKADAAGVEVDWLERNLFEWSPPPRSFDLVVVVYLHLPPEERAGVYANAVAAVAPGGRMIVIAHDPLHVAEGQAGPDPGRLFSADQLARELLAVDPQLMVEKAQIVRRVPLPEPGPIDALLVLARPASPTVGAAPQVDARRLPDLGRRGEGWFLLQLVLFAAIAAAGAAGPAWSGWLRTAGAALGMVMIAAGGVLSVWGILDLRENLTPFPRPLPGARLVETGSYRLVRHPIYGGLITASVGWGLATASPLALLGAVLLAGFFDLKSRREELWLAEQFGEYGAYRARTHRLLPWLY